MRHEALVASGFSRPFGRPDPYLPSGPILY